MTLPPIILLIEYFFPAFHLFDTPALSQTSNSQLLSLLFAFFVHGYIKILITEHIAPFANLLLFAKQTHFTLIPVPRFLNILVR